MTSRRFRILQLHNHHASLGGAMEVLEDERRLLGGAGHVVEQFTLPAAQELGLNGLQAGVKAVWNREAADAVGRRIDDFRPDVVHVHTPFPLLSPAVFRIADKRGVPAVTTVHSFRYSCIAGTCFRAGSVCEDCVGSRLKLPGLRHRCYHDSAAASGALTVSLALHRTLGTFRDIDRFITLTPFSRRLLVRDGIAEDRITVKANSVVDPGVQFERRTEQPYVAFAGRLIGVKGVETMLDAWRMGAPQGMTLKIAGDGELRDLVEARSAEDPSIEYLGWIDLAEIPRLFGEATAALVPSEWYEGGVPLVSIRALSVGTPVIMTDLENLSEDVLVDGAGVAYASGDPRELAKVLATLVTEPGAWADRGIAARRSYLARHRPAATVAALEQIYDEVVTKREAATAGGR